MDQWMRRTEEVNWNVLEEEIKKVWEIGGRST